jgi:hypothetical protein
MIELLKYEHINELFSIHVSDSATSEILFEIEWIRKESKTYPFNFAELHFPTEIKSKLKEDFMKFYITYLVTISFD